VPPRCSGRLFLKQGGYLLNKIALSAKLFALAVRAEAFAENKKNSFAEMFDGLLRDALFHAAGYNSETLHTAKAFPVSGNFKISSFFGENRGDYIHEGIDLAAPEGVPVRAFVSGRVFCSESPAGGKEIFMTGEDGTVYYYAHLSGYAVGDGVRVKAGDVIGYVGNTGRSTGPHLHFGVKRGGKWVDPLPELQRAFEKASKETGLSVGLLRAVAEVESNCNPRAVSPAGAVGVMQLLPSTAESLGVKDSYDPEENVLAGAKYLKMMLDRYDGDLVKALAAYNAGPGAVDRYGGVPPYRETRNYVRKVLNRLA